jgi:hypothetical protein
MMKNMNRSRPPLENLCMLLFLSMLIAWNWPGQTGARAQGNRNSKAQPVAGAQKHTATVRANDSPEGSRVSVSSEATLDEYEAYRRGDRFYVKLPATEVSQAASLRARGFEDVSVQKSGSSTVLSFHLQPGTTARVDQKGNHLDVIFTTPRGAQGSLTTPPASASVSPTTASGLDSVPATVPANTKGQSPVAINSTNPPPTRAGNQAAPSTPPGSSGNQNASNPQSSTDSWLGSGDWRARVKFYAEIAKLNWLPIVIGLTVALLLIAVWRSRRSKSRGSKETVRLPRKLKSEGEPTKPGPTVAPVKNEQLSELRPATASAPTPNMRVAVEPGSQENVDVARAQAEASSILTGGKYDDKPTATVDIGAREVIATELLSALAGRNPERRDRAREAFINSGYFDDATRDLRVAEAPAERASAARKLALVRDSEASPHLIAALEDEAPEVRRAAVEALADVRDPAAIPSLNELLRTERDRKVPSSVIRHAIEACATVEQPAARTPGMEQFAASKLSAAAIEPDREVIEI